MEARQLLSLYGQEDAEAASQSRVGMDADGSPVFLDQPVGDRQSQPCAAGIPTGGEKGVEDMTQGLPGYAPARIFDGNHDGIEAGQMAGGDRYFSLAVLRHGLVGVDEQIADHLLELLEVSLDGGEIDGETFFDDGNGFSHLGADNDQGAPDDLVHR